MCYYNGMRVTRDQFIRLIGIERELKGMNLVRPVANGFDYRSWPIVRPTADRKSFTVKEAHWEFIPEYIEDDIQLKEARKHQTWLNAKGENLWVNEKGKLSMWSEAAEARRCLVLSSHFFEFRHVPVIGNKGQPLKKTESIPYCITLRDRPEYFFMAGIWRTWTNHAR
ncbi:MAG TPA: SOS response-associated peptidase family protein, partial [Chryseolinea sp.]|nr:SOS response-associated peptidase family protein [Chryseolinea sp.]